MTWLDEQIEQFYGCKRCRPGSGISIMCAALSLMLSLWCIVACKDKVLLLILQAITSAEILLLLCRVRLYLRSKS